MNKIVLTCTLLFPLAIFAQAKPAVKVKAHKPVEITTIDKALDGPLSILEKDLVPLAEAMPEEKFDFVPTTGEYKDVMTFGAMVKHVAGANYFFGSWLMEEKMPQEAIDLEKGPKEAKTKAEIVQFLKNSFAYNHKAIATINKKNMLITRPAPWGGGTTTRVSMAAFATGHGFDHYGQLVEYLRLNGIVPPASRK